MAGGDADRDEVFRDFRAAVNMAPSQLERWLQTADAKRVGQKRGGGESTGHAMGRRIVTLKRARKAELKPKDLEDMRKVVGYVKRHMAQGPKKADVRTSDWRYSLMNWGHDPLKK